ncbi:glycosyltransferase family 87 protein [Protofrankia coriariae]|uniref:glycosyltransferase family 87 protein n=1 Tax=Protofrankia coriariae TaxID=1562887 RepID=UPI001F1ED186|nr:glycosyltransferase family 87 protein [Protofrankia coriariae]
MTAFTGTPQQPARPAAAAAAHGTSSRAGALAASTVGGASGGAVGGGRARPWSVLIRAAPLAALVAVLWTVYIAPLPHYDVDVFLRAGAAVGDGRGPYPPPGSAEVYSGFAYVYPYLVAFAFVPLSWLGEHGATVFIALSVGALFLGARLLGVRDRRTYALVLMSSCAITGLQMGTLNAVLFLGLAALWHFRDRPVAAGVLAAGVIYAKLFLAPVWLWLVLTRRTKAGAVAAAFVGLLLAVTELTSPVGTRTYLGMLGVLAREEAPLGLSLTGLLVNTGLGMDVATWVARAVAVAVLVVAALAGDWPRPRRGGNERMLYAGTLAAALVASPIVWSHYLLLLLAPILVSAPRSRIPLIVFTVASWFVVTPHQTGPVGFVTGIAIISVLTAPAVGHAVKTRIRRGHIDGGTADGGTAERGTGDGGTVVGDGVVGGAADTSRGADAAAAAALLPSGPVSGPVSAPVPGVVIVAAITAVAVATTVVGVGFGVELLATAYGNPQRVIGAYCALLGVLAVLGWSLRQRSGPSAALRAGGHDHRPRPPRQPGTARS